MRFFKPPQFTLTLAALACRSREALWDRMQAVLNQVSPIDAINCSRRYGDTLQMERGRSNKNWATVSLKS
jgi:hypothetical protein